MTCLKSHKKVATEQLIIFDQIRQVHETFPFVSEDKKLDEHFSRAHSNLKIFNVIIVTHMRHCLNKCLKMTRLKKC